MATPTESDRNIERTLMAIVATGFLAWSAVVWRAADTAREVYIRIDTTLTSVTARMERLETRLATHEALASHLGTQHDIEALRRDMERIDAAHRMLTGEPNNHP